MSSTAPIERPWEHIPNPFGFLSIGEHAKHVYPQQPRYHSILSSSSKPSQRTHPVGRDWLGRGFQRGDVLLATIAGSNAMVEVEDILLDDGRGQAYLSGSRGGMLAVERDSGTVIFKEYRNTEPRIVDPEWISPGLGLVSLGAPSQTHSGSYAQHLSDSFDLLQLQGFRVRCKPLDGSNRMSFAPDKLSVVGGDSMDKGLYRLYMENTKVPLLDR